MRISFLLVLLCSPTQAKGGTMILEHFAMSPDGRTVAFQYLDQESKRHGLGLLEWETGKLTPIPNPTGTDMGGDPSFSHDGKHLLAMLSSSTSGQIVSIDLATLKLTELAQAGRDWRTPVFQPGTGNILFVDGGPGTRPGGYRFLKLLNLSDHTEQTVLEEKDGFRVISNLSFVSQNEIIFQAQGPVDTKLTQEVVEIVKRPAIANTTTAYMVYRLKIGERPEIILKEITAQSVRTTSFAGTDTGAAVVQLGPVINAVSASRDGKVMVFTDLSSTTPRSSKGAFNYEIYKLEDGKLTQMTHMLSKLYATNVHALPFTAHVSYDGTTVAFGLMPPRRLQDVDLFMLDVRSGEVRPTRLLEKLAERPEFILP